MNTLTPGNIEEMRQAVRGHGRVLVRGAGTKCGQSFPSPHGGGDECIILGTTALAGVTEYDPGEFTFTALAGTPLRDIAAALAGHGQYLPFDPPLVEAGATLGGTVAAGLSGPGRLRYGGLRDFIIGVRFIDGGGTLIHGGGKVVKNAAGFDLPKLMVGSLGRLGVLVELTFKVFPRSPAAVTLRIDAPRLAGALAMIPRLTTAALELDALDLEPPGTLVVRLAGDSEALPARVARVAQAAGAAAQTIGAGEAEAYWRGVNEWGWAGGEAGVKIPTTLRRVAALDERLGALGVSRRYSVAGNVAWAAWPAGRGVAALDAALKELKLSGLLLGAGAPRTLGADAGGGFGAKIKGALDPAGRFPWAAE